MKALVSCWRASAKYSRVHCAENQGATAMRAYALSRGRLAMRVALAGTWLASSVLHWGDERLGT